MIGWLIGIGAGLSIAGGLGKAHYAAKARKAQIEAQKTEIDNAIKRGDKQLQDNLDTLKQNYDFAMNDLEDSRKQNVSALGYTSTQRASDARTSSFLNVKQSDLEYQELAQILVSGEQSVGSAVSSSAQTGFRNTGSNQNIVKETQRLADYQASMALSQIELSSAQRFSNASSNYFSQTSQIDSYRQNLATIERRKEENTSAYNLSKNQMEENWKTEKDLLDQQKGNLDFGSDDIWDILNENVIFPTLQLGTDLAFEFGF